MSKLDDLVDVLRKKVSNEIEDYWSESSTYGEIELSLGLNPVVYITEPEKFEKKIKSRLEKGVYMWIYNDVALYVGKTDSPTTSIHSRQYNHIRSFKMPLNKAESSGRKYREFMKENGLQNMKIVIKYINTLKYDIGGLAEMLETASIKHYRPKINREVKGNGKRS